MVGVVSSIPSRGNFIFADFETPRCQFCTKLPEMSDLCYLEKTRTKRFYNHSHMYFVYISNVNVKKNPLIFILLLRESFFEMQYFRIEKKLKNIECQQNVTLKTQYN